MALHNAPMEVLTPDDIIGRLPIGRDAVYRLLREGRIRSVRVGRKYIITSEALEDFLNSRVGLGTVN